MNHANNASNLIRAPFSIAQKDAKANGCDSRKKKALLKPETTMNCFGRITRGELAEAARTKQPSPEPQARVRHKQMPVPPTGSTEKRSPQREAAGSQQNPQRRNGYAATAASAAQGRSRLPQSAETRAALRPPCPSLSCRKEYHLSRPALRRSASSRPYSCVQGRILYVYPNLQPRSPGPVS